MPYLFIGEKRSKTAIAKGWTWADGRLAAKTLQEALAQLGLEHGKHYECVNLFYDNGTLDPVILTLAHRRQLQGWDVVGMGARVAQALRTYGLPHLRIIHPAARGKIRNRATYHAHVKERLSTVLLSGCGIGRLVRQDQAL